MKQTIASDYAITRVGSAIGGAVLGARASGLRISFMGVLSAAGGVPVQVYSDINSSHTFNISNVHSSNLRAASITCTNWSNFTGYSNTLHNISSTNLPCTN